MKKLITSFLSIILLFSGCGMPEQPETVSGGSEPLTNSVSESEPELPTSLKPSSELEVPASDWVILPYKDANSDIYKRYDVKGEYSYWLSDTELIYAARELEPERTIFRIRKYDVDTGNEQTIFTYEEEHNVIFDIKYLTPFHDFLGLGFTLHAGNKYMGYGLLRKDWSVSINRPLNNLTAHDIREFKDVSQMDSFLQYIGGSRLLLDSAEFPHENDKYWNEHIETKYSNYKWSEDGRFFMALNKDDLVWGEVARAGVLVPEQLPVPNGQTAQYYERYDVFSYYGAFIYKVEVPYSINGYTWYGDTLYSFNTSKFIHFSERYSDIYDIEFKRDEHGRYIKSGTYDPRLNSAGIFHIGEAGILFFNFETGALNTVENIDVPSDVEYVSFNPSGTVCFWVRGESPSLGISKVK